MLVCNCNVVGLSDVKVACCTTPGFCTASWEGRSSWKAHMTPKVNILCSSFALATLPPLKQATNSFSASNKQLLSKQQTAHRSDHGFAGVTAFMEPL